MAVYKVERCQACGFRRNVSAPKVSGTCPKCPGKMEYSDNWYISFKSGGKKFVEAIGPKKREAEDALAKKRTNIREGKHFEKAPATPWRIAADHFRAWVKVNVAAHTQRMYENSLDILEPYFSAYSLDRISAPMVEQFKAARLQTVTNSTVNRDLATIKRMFALCETPEWGLLRQNNVKTVKLLKENPHRSRFLSDEEINSLLDNCKLPHLRMAVLIALNTGLRKEGILTLRWDEIRDRTVTKTVKGGKTIQIPLSESLEKALNAWKASRRVLSPFILCNDKGRPYSDIKKGFYAALDNAGIKNFRFHDLRHTFASHFLMSTGDFQTLKEILGHSDISITMKVYAHLSMEHKHKAMAAFDSLKNFGGGTL